MTRAADICSTAARSCRGFSSIDILVSTSIGLMLLTGVMSLGTFQLTSMHDQTKQVDLQSVARGVLNLFQREVRRVGLDPSCSRSFAPVASASSHHLIIQADLDGNGVIDGAGEYVGYFYLDDLDAIFRYAGNGMEKLIDGVDLGDSRLRYFDATGNEIAANSHLDGNERASVQRIRLELALSDDSSNGSNEQRLGATVSSDVTLRNRFFMSDSNCETPPDDVVLSSGDGEGDISG